MQVAIKQAHQWLNFGDSDGGGKEDIVAACH